MSTTIKLKRGRAATWASLNPILEVGEIGLVVNDYGEVVDRKTGDGSSAWNDLERDPIYWDQIVDPFTNEDVLIEESQVTGLVEHLAEKAPLISPALTGTPTAPTAATETNTTQLATTAFVQAARIKSDWDAVSGTSEILNKPDLSLKANLASPALTGTPTAPTAATGTNTTQLATTAFVQAARVKSDWDALSGLGEILNKPGNATTSVDGLMSSTDKIKLDSIGGSLVKCDWDAPTGSYNEILNKPEIPDYEDLSEYALLDSPDFIGIPTAPTAATGTDNTQIATTAFVQEAVSSYPFTLLSIDGGSALD